jgi:hypothetical protein
MKRLFADTFYWVASINPEDAWHSQVRAFTTTLDQVQIITIDEVLIEVLTFFLEVKQVCGSGQLSLSNAP